MLINHSVLKDGKNYSRISNKSKTRKITFLLLLGVIANLAFAQSTLNVDKVTIFTDANSYIQKSGTIEAENGIYELSGEELPAARFGTLEITDKDKSIQSITSTIKPKDKEEITVDVTTTSQLLRSNKGILLDIITEKETITGVLQEVFTNYLVIKTDKTVIVKLSEITSMEFASEPIFTRALIKDAKQDNPYDERNTNKNDDATITIKFSSEGKKNLSMKYLQQGLSWSPVYTLRLETKKKASLLLQAEIMNDTEDLESTELDLVLGTPTFNYDIYITDLLNFNKKFDPFYDATSNYAIKTTAQYLKSPDKPDDPNNRHKNKNKLQHDFIIHKLNDITLHKNSRGMYRLQETELPYRHIYECDLIDLDYGNNNRNNKDLKNKVFHSILIENNTENLFGSGSIFVIDSMQKRDLPLAQSTLDYIPAKSSGTVKVTENHEVEITHKEVIIERSKNKIDFWGRNYYETTIEGTIVVKNFKAEKIELMIRNMIEGELTVAGDNSEIIYQRQPVYSPNYESKIKWTLNLKAGEEQTITYQYKFLKK